MGKNKGGLVKAWAYKAMRCAVYQTEMGHLCGYVGITSDHPLYGKGYSDHIPGLSRKQWAEGREIGDRGVMTIFLAMSDSDEVRLDLYFDIHGSLTYASQGGDYPTEGDSDLWFFGFDCAHHEDTPEDWNEERVTSETERLADQLSDFRLPA